MAVVNASRCIVVNRCFTQFYNLIWLYMAVSFHSWRNRLFLGVNQQPSVSNWQLHVPNTPCWKRQSDTEPSRPSCIPVRLSAHRENKAVSLKRLSMRFKIMISGRGVSSVGRGPDFGSAWAPAPSSNPTRGDWLSSSFTSFQHYIGRSSHYSITFIVHRGLRKEN